MLTAKSDTVDIVVGLGQCRRLRRQAVQAQGAGRPGAGHGCGTDDPKPETLAVGDLAIDVANHSVKRDGTAIPLTTGVRPARLPRAASVAGVHQEELLEKVWGYRHAAGHRLVNVHVQRLRSKVELDPERPEVVVTVRGCRLQGRSGLT